MTTEEEEVPLLRNREVGEASEPGLLRRVWNESKKLWRIVGPAIFLRITSYSMNLATQAFAGHLGDLELAAMSVAATFSGFSFGLMACIYSSLIMIVLILVDMENPSQRIVQSFTARNPYRSAWNGERPGDALRPSLRREEAPHVGSLPAALVDRPLRMRRAPPPSIHHGHPVAGADGGAGRASSRGGPRVHLDHPHAPFLRLPLPPQPVLSESAQELGLGRHIRIGARRSHLPQLASGVQVGSRPSGCRAHVMLLMVAPGAGPVRLRGLREVSGDLEGLLHGRLLGIVGVRQVIGCLWGHALVRLSLSLLLFPCFLLFDNK